MSFGNSPVGDKPLAWRASDAGGRQWDETSSGNLGAPVHQRRILVVEDDVETADFLVTLLENAGYEVEIATDGQYCLILVDSFEPELILMDTTLPGMSSSE